MNILKCALSLSAMLLFACSDSSNSPTDVPSSSIQIISPAVTVEDGAVSYLLDSLNTNEAKLVFRNDESGNLVYMDFTKDSTYFVEFAAGIDVYHPTISPDGKWVAFCTKPEPISGNSNVYVLHLDTNDYRIVSLNASGVVLRWRVLPAGDTVLIYASSAGVNDSNNFWNAQSTWKVPFQKGAFGTPEKLFTGSFHGGVSADFRLAVTGSHYLRVHSRLSGTDKDTVWYDSAQVCNVSLATDGSLRTTFLDMAGARGKEYVGETYLPHCRLLVADSLGNLIQTVASPEYYAFDHTEWVWGSDHLFSATLQEFSADLAHTKIAVGSLLDSSTTILVSGTELWHPDLWLSSEF